MLVENKRERLIFAQEDGITAVIIPGVNEFDLKDWNLLRSKLNQSLLNDDLEELYCTKEKDSIKNCKNLKDLSDAQAKTIVKKTYSLSTLDKFMESESRSEIRALLHTQKESVLNHGVEA